MKVPVAFKARDFDRDVALNSTAVKFLCNIWLLSWISKVMPRGVRGKRVIDHSGANYELKRRRARQYRMHSAPPSIPPRWAKCATPCCRPVTP